VPTPLTAASGAMKAKGGGATLYEAADASSRTFGRLAAGTAVTVQASAGDMTKVSLGDGRFGFVKTSELEQGGAPAAQIAFDEVMRRFPPAIEVQPVVLATKDPTVSVRGLTSDSDRLLDAYIFVGSKKIFYRSNRNGQDAKKMPFEAAVPLRPGVNVITVVARENPDTVGRKTLIVRKDGPNGEILQTPKTEEDGEIGGASDD
jgi:carboxyl-terminal processing protease